MADSDRFRLIVEFQRRRKEVWRRFRLWALGLVPLVVAIPLMGALDVVARLPYVFWTVVIPLGALASFAAFRMVRTVQQLYRCPSCEKVITEGDGIALNPMSCPHCDVPLSERALS